MTQETLKRLRKATLSRCFQARHPMRRSFPVQAFVRQLSHFATSHAKRVCSDRFSYILAPIGAFGAQINQPVVALMDSHIYLN
jgi:hypothetical protein